MGLNTGGGSRKYLKISEGRIALKVEEGTAGAIKCASAKDPNKTWYEIRFPSITGRITDIKKRETPYGPDLSITIVDDHVYELQMGWSSRYSSGFFLCMPNIDFSGEVTFTPWMKEIDGKKKTMLYITNGKPEMGKENVKWAWTKDNPGECPDMKQVKVKGELVWDDSERQEFFENYLNTVILPKLASAAPHQKAEQVVSDTQAQDDDDLPF